MPTKVRVLSIDVIKAFSQDRLFLIEMKISKHYKVYEVNECQDIWIRDKFSNGNDAIMRLCYMKNIRYK